MPRMPKLNRLQILTATILLSSLVIFCSCMFESSCSYCNCKLRSASDICGVQHGSRLSNSRKGQNKATGVSIALALHHASSVRNTVLQSISTLPHSALVGLLESLQSWLRIGLPQTLVTEPKSEEPVNPSEVAGRMHTAVVQIFEAALKSENKGAISGEDLNLPAEVLALTLQVVSHPFVAGYLRTSKNSWKQFQR